MLYVCKILGFQTKQILSFCDLTVGCSFAGDSLFITFPQVFFIMKKKNFLKKALIGLVIFLVLFIGALVAIPFLFKDEIIAAVKELVNENLNATVDFESVDISLLKSFPNLSIGLENYSVTGLDEFQDVRLAAGEYFGVTADFWSAWNFGKVPLNIKSLRLDKPEIRILILPDGRVNYDIAKPSTDTTALEYQIKLQKYAINGGHIVYDDRQGRVYAELVNLNHSGAGDFTQDIFDLKTKTTIDELTAELGGISYLKKVKAKLDAGFNIDLPQSKYTLKENELKINDLELQADGWVALPNDEDIEMEISFNAPKSNFKDLFSMIPKAYIEGYEKVKAGGKFKLDGFVKGVYSEQSERYPSFKINLNVENGEVKYPDLPMGISNINAAITVNSPDSDLDKMLVDVENFKLKIGNNPLEGYFKLRTPLSDPDVDTKIKGLIDLGDFVRAYPMEGVKTMNGLIRADVKARAKMSTIDKGDYANVDMSGEASIESLDYVAEGLPPVRIDAMRLFFTPKNVQVPNFDMKMGKSDLSGSGSIDNLLAYFSPEAVMKGDFSLRSGYFNADEWITEEEATAGSTVGGAPAAADEELFNRFDFTLDAEIAKLDYEEYQVKDLVAKGNFTPNRLTAEQLSGRIGDSDFSASGVLTNVWNYVFSNETLGGDLSLRSNYMNLNQFMADDAGAASPDSASEPILVPANMDLRIDARMGKVIYDNMELTDLNGRLTVANEEVRFTDMSAKTLGGNIAINGGYNTQNHDKPKFDFGMKLQQMDFQRSFNTFNTFQAIAPIGEYLQGAFNTELTLSSELTRDLMPDLATLTAAGLLQTLNGQVKGLAPLEEIGNKLNVDAFKSLSLKDTKNWFTVKDGAVQLQEFDHKFQNIDMKIGGSHQLTGGMDYQIVAKIPRSKIGKNPLGAAANTGLDFLSGEASKLGLDLSAGEFVNVQINIGGTLKSPKISFKLLGSDGSPTSVQEAVVNKVQEEAQKKLDQAKAEAEARLEAERKRLEEEARKKAAAIEAEAKRKLEEEAKKATDKISDEVKNKLNEEAKKKLEDLNPFNKNKKKGN